VVSTVSIPELSTSHVFNGSYRTIKAATCTETGTKIGECTNCGAIVSTVTIDKLAHPYGSWNTIKAATCETAGIQTRTCTGNGCTASETKDILATGHIFNGSYTVTKEPTCSEIGTKEGRCSTCKKVVSTVSIPKLATAHTFNGSYRTTKAATCTETGTKVGECTNCGEIVSTVTIDKLGHSYSPWETISKATCISLGIRERRCTRSGCDLPCESEIIKVTEHDIEDFVTRQATCSEPGEKEERCSYCEKVFSTVTIPPQGINAETGHKYTYERTIAPTSTRTGLELGKCDVCEKTTTRVVDKISEEDYTYNLLPADGNSPYGYVNFNGIKYPIAIAQVPGESAFVKARTTIAEINKDKRSFNWAGFIGGFSLTDDYNDFHEAGAYASGGFVLLTDVLGQVANNIETSYYSIIISEATDGTEYRASILIGSSGYENNVASIGTGKETSFYQMVNAAGGTTVFITSNSKKLYEYVTGEEGDFLTLYDVIFSLDPRREGGKYTENLYVNSNGEIVRHLIPFINDKLYLGKVTLLGLSYEKLLDISYIVDPSDSRFVGPFIK